MKVIKSFISIYFFAYKYIYRVNCCFAVPALGIYGYLLFKYRDSTLNEIVVSYMASAFSGKLYINGVLSENLLVDWKKFYEIFTLYMNILYILIPVCVLCLYILTLISFMRDLSSRNFVIARTGRILDDIGFAITFCSLTGLYTILFATNIDGILFVFIGSFVQSTTFLFSLKNKAYGYSLKKRSRKIVT